MSFKPHAYIFSSLNGLYKIGFPADKKYLLELGITKEVFHAITWFTSWAVDADHGANLRDVTDCRPHLESM